VCGDAVVEGPEACDDGNDDETDACLSTCAAASCGDGFVHAGVEACDGGAVTNGACSAMCALTCNQGFADCNGVAGDGCEVDTQADEANCGGCGKPCAANQTCTASQCVGGMQEFGPEHNFVGLQSNHFITQGCCSTGCQPNEAGMADYFCKHFYNAQCTAKPGYFTAQTPFPEYPKMHKRDGCTSNGSDIPNTQCDGGPCKIGNWSESTSGLTNLVCVCP
jgi:cysteine-rich repeat protein